MEYEKNKTIDLTISTAKPPIFWKDKETTKLQVQNWSPQKLRLLIYKINELELIIKKNFNKNKTIKFIDLSADFRITDPKVYEKNYKTKHKAKKFLIFIIKVCVA